MKGDELYRQCQETAVKDLGTYVRWAKECWQKAGGMVNNNGRLSPQICHEVDSDEKMVSSKRKERENELSKDGARDWMEAKQRLGWLTEDVKYKVEQRRGPGGKLRRDSAKTEPVDLGIRR